VGRGGGGYRGPFGRRFPAPPWLGPTDEAYSWGRIPARPQIRGWRVVGCVRGTRARENELDYYALVVVGAFTGSQLVAQDDSGSDNIERVHCNQCGNETKHTVVAMRNHQDSSPADDEYQVLYTTYTALECRGCGHVCLRRVVFLSEWNDGDEEVTFFPPRVSRKEPRWLEQQPEPIQRLVREVYAALHADSRSLAMMGGRAILDTFIVARIGDVGSFRDKLNAMETKGHLSTRQVKVLDAALNAGHAAAHRGHVPSASELEAVMDIVENLLQLDLLDAAANTLTTSIPARSARKPRRSRSDDA